MLASNQGRNDLDGMDAMNGRGRERMRMKKPNIWELALEIRAKMNEN
jgi:hypothetical protein